MCQTNAYVVKGGSEDMLMEGVARLEVGDGVIALVGIFGDRQEVAGRIREINFQAGKLVIEAG
jgi:predicted RNA-binding protein